MALDEHNFQFPRDVSYDRQGQVSHNPGKSVGSAHVPVGLATILELMKTVDAKKAERKEENQPLEELKQWWKREMQDQDEDASYEQIRIFRVSTPKTMSKQWSKKGKGKKAQNDKEPEDYVKIEFCLEDKVAEKNLCKLMTQEGGVQKTGPAPANRDARLIKELLRELE